MSILAEVKKVFHCQFANFDVFDGLNEKISWGINFFFFLFNLIFQRNIVGDRIMNGC